MKELPGSDPDPFVSETLRFAQHQFRASASIFSWIGPDRSVLDHWTAGVPVEIFDLYLDGMFVNDPLNIHWLLRSARPFVFQKDELQKVPAPRLQIHLDFLASYGVRDEMNFVFSFDQRPVAFLALLKRTDDPDFGEDAVDPEAFHRYVECNILRHPAVMAHIRGLRLSETYGLTQREIDVVECLLNGATNIEVAEMLGIGVATVKSHVIHILDKFGVENRTAIVAFANAVADGRPRRRN